MSDVATINIPASFPSPAFDMLKAANKGALFIFPGDAVSKAVTLAPDGTPTLHRSAWLLLCDVLKPLLVAGTSIYLSPAVAPFAKVIADRGVDSVVRWIEGNAGVERFSVADIEAIPDAVDPQT